MKLTLISRTYCHLCHEMEAALVPLAGEFGIEIEVLDADADPDSSDDGDEEAETGSDADDCPGGWNHAYPVYSEGPKM